MKFLCAVLLLLSAKCFAQYPFEKLPLREVDSVKFKAVKSGSNWPYVATAHYKNYKIKLVLKAMFDSTDVSLYKGTKLIKKIKVMFPVYMPFPLYIYNNNGKVEFLVSYYNGAGNGLAASIICKVWLIDKGHNNFAAIICGDFNNDPSREYRFGNDSAYEIVCESLAEYRGHDYWLFDLYNFRNGKLINVSNKYGYPIAVPYLLKETYKPTTKIPKKELQKLSRKLPEDYAQN